MRTELPVSKKAVIANTSFCNDTKALLVLAFTNNSETKPPHSLSFSFTAVSDVISIAQVKPKVHMSNFMSSLEVEMCLMYVLSGCLWYTKSTND